jgi:cystathionine beta-lyase
MKWMAYPSDVLPLWVAEMDVMPHPKVREALSRAVEIGDLGYPWGLGYSQAFQAMAKKRWDWELPDKQIMTAGDVMANIQSILLALTKPGDTVVINPPVYPPFRKVITVYGRKIVEAPLSAAGRLDFATLEAAFARPERPKAYLLCSPHNPTGTIHTREELTRLLELANAHGVTVISDEIHATLIDPGQVFTPILTLPGSEAALSTTSAGKSWNLAGLKGGLVMGGADSILPLLRPILGNQGGHLAYLAHTAALTYAQGWVDDLMAEVAANKQLLAQTLAEKLPQVRYSPAQGTYLAWLDCTDLGLADPKQAFAERGRVAFNAGADFGVEHRQWVRVNLACNPDFISEAVDRMAASL